MHNYVYFSLKMCFLSFHLKVKVAEDLIESGIKDHTIGPTNLKKNIFLKTS